MDCKFNRLEIFFYFQVQKPWDMYTLEAAIHHPASLSR